MQKSSLRLPLQLLAVLSVTIICAAAALFGFVEREPVPVPILIGCGSRSADGGICSVSTGFVLSRPVDRASLMIAGTGPVRAVLDGAVQSSASAKGEPTEVVVRGLAPGAHDLRIEVSASDGSPAVSAYMDLPVGVAASARIATDATWEVVGGGAAVAAREPAGGTRAAPFGDVPDSVTTPRDGRFWSILAMLLASMVICCLAGPVLRPAASSRADTAVVNLAIIVPSIAYGAVAFIITSLAASDLGIGALVTMHLVSTAIFVLLLMAWKGGSEHADVDQSRHRAELAGYDAMCDAVELLNLELSQAPGDLRAALESPIRELAESVRHASAGASTADLDDRILQGIESLRNAVRSGSDAAAAAEIAPGVRSVIGFIREREIVARSRRRA